MSLPSSFEHHQEYFEECVTFLQKYQHLFKFANTEILVKNVLNHMETEDVTSLNLFDRDFNIVEDELKVHFEELFVKLERLTVVHNTFVQMNMEGVSEVPLGPKKKHEIVHLAKEVKDMCAKNGCDVVVDFGSGLGYLDQYIFETSHLKVLGLERNTSHYVGAKKRQGKYHKSSLENVKYIKHTVSELSFLHINSYLHDKFTKYDGLCITGLHSCADLTVTAMNIFLKMAEAKALVLMPCCYHKMEQENDRFKNFPLSNSLREIYEKHNGYEYMGVPFLRLGTQPPYLVDDNLEDLVFNLLARAVLQLYANKHCCKLKRNKRKPVKTKHLGRNFEDYINDACNGFRFIRNFEHSVVNNKDDNISQDLNPVLDDLRDIWQEVVNEHLLKKAAIFIIIQNNLQPVIENLILYDRVVYLMERGYKSKFKRIVNERISPRSLALFASKNNLTL